MCVCVCVCMHVHAQSHSCVQFFATSWTVVHQTSLSMEFSRQEYWSGVPFPTPGNLPNPGTEPTSLDSHIGRQILYCCLPGKPKGRGGTYV